LTIEVRVYRDHMELIAPSGLARVEPRSPYSSSRLLVGEFEPAVECLERGLRELGAIGLLRKRPELVIRAMECNEGGLSGVEQRCLTELAAAAGAGSVAVR